MADITLSASLAHLEPCEEAVIYLDDHTDARTAWAECERGDWMLWLLGRLPNVKRETLVLAACDCAEPALAHVPDGEDHPRKAIETARAWCRGEATLDDVQTAASAASAANAASAAYASAASAAANAAAYAAANAAAANAAYAAAYAAAANAASAAYASAASAAANAARIASLAESADIVRRHFPEPPEVRHG